MPEWDAEVAVVGLGAWGASALWRLASRGVDVLGIERYQPGHALGASHGGSRMFRLTCLEHPGLVPLARRSLELWRELESDAGETLLHQVGGLLIGPPDGSVAGGTLRAAAEHGIEVERLGSAELRERFPQHANVPDGHIGVWEPSAGILRPEGAVRAAVRVAEAAGARVYRDTAVSALELVPGGAVVRTSARTLRVRQVVVTVGAWLSSLVPGLPIEVLRMPITWYRPVGDRAPFALERFPVFMRERDNGLIVWGSGWEGRYDVKLGLENADEHRRPLDPETDDRSVGPDDWSKLSAELATAIPGLEPLPAKVGVCMLAETPDGQFVLGRPGGDARLLIAGGCNAHGFKHASGIGEALARWVTGEPDFCDLSFTNPDRF
ncbi:N-methyl-L-tryptophan oxidase [Goodfellowiella coeruleoviolacea]|uniref:Sarcosine oxidase n=1 Tax=Goodfellowiella coeruleoviolacea TaxID=334858 RepID=A0AAE3KCV2_9PSEU|nr:N-methyl-L-tryptophan oxidase [Goodfellowiella coeruleoviolacea]MCP2163311.1 sarcosine oxidase [Goodfellowiella coeruleoviolacea]